MAEDRQKMFQICPKNDEGNKDLSDADAVDRNIVNIKEKEVSATVAKESASIPLLEDSKLDASTYSGQKVSYVGKKKVFSEDDKCNENSSRKFLQDVHAAVFILV